MTLYRIQFAHVNEDRGTVSWSNHPYAFCSPKAALKFAGYLDDRRCGDGARVWPPVTESLWPVCDDAECPF
jgi:hypothetical protein